MVTGTEHARPRTSSPPHVCAVDGSAEAEDSVAQAVADCLATGAELILVAVLPPAEAGRDEHAERVRLAQNALIDAIAAARRAGIGFTASSRCC